MPAEFLQVSPEIIDVVFADDSGGHDEGLVLRNVDVLTAKFLCHQRYRLTAELVRVLDDSPFYNSVFHALYSVVLFVERDEFYFTSFTGIFDRTDDGGA